LTTKEVRRRLSPIILGVHSRIVLVENKPEFRRCSTQNEQQLNEIVEELRDSLPSGSLFSNLEKVKTDLLNHASNPYEETCHRRKRRVRFADEVKGENHSSSEEPANQ
jgi:hypothetical protein